MIQLLHLYIFLILTAEFAHAGPNITVSRDMMTLCDQTSLTCCHRGQNISQCSFYSDFKFIGQQNASDNCCKLIVSGEQLLESKAENQLQTAVNVHCIADLSDYISNNVTITVRSLPLSCAQTLILLVILGILILLSLLTFIVTCIARVSRKQGRGRQFHPVGDRAQEVDNDFQGVNPDTEEEQEEKTEEKAEDEILYATVSHSGSRELFNSTVQFESGTEYAVVLMN